MIMDNNNSNNNNSNKPNNKVNMPKFNLNWMYMIIALMPVSYTHLLHQSDCPESLQALDPQELPHVQP